ncbi:class I adenylate-forming enzyme family protein [Acrocarpospora catenulata]|uniref:class I adenylate-forming enzyme family protein n=1 Tax=Acrocarpospora catenulata TaxID=2836182 RepID=UPI001BDB3D9A|nr:class I adenylate-forming enzyme family protein [Acrocarpospora catenulata]
MSLLVHQPWRDAARWHRSGLWRQVTLPGLLNGAARERPGGTAYIEGDAVTTWGNLRSAAASMAHDLLTAGCARSDVVVVVLPDGPELIAVMTAAQAIGAVAAPLPHSTGAAEIAAIAGRTSARVVVADRSLPLPIPILQPGPLRHWLGGDNLPLPPAGHVPDADAVADLMFTSGTTGRPKGVMNSANTKFTALRGFLSSYELTRHDVWGVIAPMCHNAGWLYTALPAIATGAALVRVGRGDPERMLDLLERHRVTITFLVPTHLSDLVLTYRRHPGRWKLSLRNVITGAAPNRAEVMRAAIEDWGITPISMYGMTECQGNLFTRSEDPTEVITSTVGRPCPGSEVALRDPETGEIIKQDGRTGELVTRGPTTFLGYYDDQAATTAAFTDDGWFLSGDLGQWTKGSMRIVGRVKEVILRGGHTLSPDAIELAFADCEGIGEVVALGLPDDRLGERVCLGVTGTVPDRVALRAHLARKGLGPHLLPDEVRPIPELPRTVLGKPKRAQVRSLFTQPRSSPPASLT